MSRKLFWPGVFMILLISSCAKEISQEDLIKDAVELKVLQWKEEQIGNCRASIIEKAGHHVDSLLLETSLDEKLDTIPKPDKPVKPIKPAFKTQPDSLQKKD